MTFMKLNMIQDSLTKEQPFDAQAQVFKALTHPVRIAILEILRDGEHCVCHMEAYLGFRQSYISQQLSVLRDANIVQDRRDGWNIFYRVVNPQIYDVLDAVQKLTGNPKSAWVAPSGACTCPHCAEKRIES